MKIERLEEISHDTGMPVDLVREAQLDDNHLTRWQRFKKGLRGNLRDLSLQFAPVIAAALIYGGFWTNENVLTRNVFPLAWYDKNNDGVQDAVLAFPIKCTDSAIMRWADGVNLAKNGVNVPTEPKNYPMSKPIRIHYLDTKSLPLNLVDSFYNTGYSSTHTFVGTAGETYRTEQYNKHYFGSEGYPLEEMLKKPEAQDKRKILGVAGDYGSVYNLADLE